MTEELQVLQAVSQRLEAAHIPFMLTGSFAMAYYGQPRMTRDIDLVVLLREDDVPGIMAALSSDFYIDADDVRSAIQLVWAKDANSELQRRDVRNLLDGELDRKHLDHWAARLDGAQLLKEIAG